MVWISLQKTAQAKKKKASSLTLELFTDLFMSNSTHTDSLEAVGQLIEVIAKLRDPNGGCPWDLEQTAQTLTPYILEEAYETVAAIKSGDQTAIVEELGDLFLQVVLQAQIASEAGVFTLKEIAQGITKKMERRHPHVFGEVQVKDSIEVSKNWEEIKSQEKGYISLSQQLQSYLNTLPPLLAASKISHKAANNGFEWENVEGVWAKFNEELTEFKESLQTEDQAHQQAELGDLLFTCVNIARWYGLNPSEGLTGTNQRFIERLTNIESQINRPLSDYSLEELEILWRRAKAQLKQQELT